LVDSQTFPPFFGYSAKKFCLFLVLKDGKISEFFCLHYFWEQSLKNLLEFEQNRQFVLNAEIFYKFVVGRFKLRAIRNLDKMFVIQTVGTI
jgi:hypothetical protein